MFRQSMALVAILGLASIGRAGAEAYFEERVHDFGATPKGPQLVHYFRYTNSGKETLTISNVRVSCGCVTASAPVTQVKPGESSYITASMDSRRFSGPKSVTIFVQFSSPRYEEISLQVQANGRDDFSMSPDSIAFGTIRKGSEAKASVRVTLFGDPNWDVSDAKAESNYVKPSVKLVKRNGAEVTYEISANLRNDLPVGKWFTDVWLTTNNPSLNKVRVPLTVDVNAPVTVTPGALLLGDIKVGDSIERNVLVKGDKPFKIKSVQGTDTQVEVTGAGTEAKVIHMLKIIVNPAQPGAISRDLSIVADDGEETTVPLPVRATATKE